MKLRYQQATISFCIDLTSPSGESFPVANLLVGETDGQQVAGVAVIVPDNLDPLSKAVLNDTHQLIKKYVDEAFLNTAPSAPLHEILRRVYHSLRNTMHVSTISEPEEVVVEDSAQIGSAVMGILQQGLTKALRESGLSLVPEVSAPSTQPLQPRIGVPVPEIPQSFIWAPPSRNVALASAR